MNKKLTQVFFCFSILFGIKSNAQNCLQKEIDEENKQLHPEFHEIRDQLENETRIFKENYTLNKSISANTKVIPVVFHILHTGGLENISMAQIRD